MPLTLSKEATNYVQAQIAALNDELYALQHSIWENPELMYEETFAHATLTGFMSKQPGWEVTPHAYGLDTAFLCEFKHKPEQNSAVISFNSEFDALPNIGHACGHNLIAVCGVTAALATSMAMTKFDIAGTIRLIGTPAEESGGGKIKLLDAGAYKDVDVSLMAHPSNGADVAYGFTNANQRFKLEYFGKEAHAAASPWQGVNALDAMVLMYNSVSVLRQQLMPKDIVQCHVSEGGHAPNIITGYSSATFAVRAPTLARLREIQAKVINCAAAGALATGCKYKVTYLTNYYNMVCNDVLAELYSECLSERLGKEMKPIDEDRRTSVISASTDQGNVSWAVPALQPMFQVVCPTGPHTKAFTEAASTEQGHNAAITAGLGLAFTGLELLNDDKKLAAVKESWAKDMDYNKKIFSDACEPVSDLSVLQYKE